jgi:hypothetical protein
MGKQLGKVTMCPFPMSILIFNEEIDIFTPSLISETLQLTMKCINSWPNNNSPVLWGVSGSEEKRNQNFAIFFVRPTKN